MESILPNDDQILSFLVDKTPNPIIMLWCRRQVQMYIDNIQTSDNGTIIGDVLFGKIKPIQFRQPTWSTSDETVLGLLPLSFTYKMGRRVRYQICKLIRMVYFLDFFRVNTPVNEFTGKFNFISDRDAVQLFKTIFWNDPNIRDTKRQRAGV
jgi:hypothetical protein